MKTVGMITIGQAPRDDVVPEMEKLLGPGFRVVQAGALDGLSRAEVERLAPGPGQDPLTTRLADGTGVVLAKEAILAHLQRCLDRLADADALVILCTGKFPRFTCARPLLEPDRILFGATRAVFGGGTLGIVIPIEEQRAVATTRWSPVSPAVTVAVASPYRGAPELARAAETLRRAGAGLVVMDCMGFTQAAKDMVHDLTGVPVLLASSLIARFVAEIV
jgi:protein AroM